MSRIKPNLGVLIALLIVIGGFVFFYYYGKGWESKLAEQEVDTSSIFSPVVNVNTGSTIDPYQEVIDYYKFASANNALSQNKQLVEMIELAMTDGSLSNNELDEIRTARKSQLEAAAAVALFSGDTRQPLYSNISHYTATSSDMTQGIYQNVLNYKITIANMIELDDAMRIGLLRRIDAAVADKNIDKKEHDEIEQLYNNVMTAHNKKRLQRLTNRGLNNG